MIVVRSGVLLNPEAIFDIQDTAYRNFCGVLDWFSLSVGGVGYRVVVWNSFQSMPVPYAGATLSSGSGVVAFSPFRRASGMNDSGRGCAVFM